jgi:ABC transporter transmembrane region
VLDAGSRLPPDEGFSVAKNRCLGARLDVRQQPAGRLQLDRRQPLVDEGAAARDEAPEMGIDRDWQGAALLEFSLSFGGEEGLFEDITGYPQFRHLLRVPMAYFEKCHIGDLVSRFVSTEPVRTLLAEGLVTALIDGAMAVLTAAMMFLYRPTLALVVLAALALNIAGRIGFYHLLRRARLS